MRKLRRNPKRLEESIKQPLKKKKLVLYKKKRCSYVNPDGNQCHFFCVGRGNVCGQHGGTPAEESLVETSGMYSALFRQYNPAVHPMQYILLSKDGKSEVEIAAELGISIATMRKWADKYKEFSVAYEIGQSMHEAWWIQEGKDNLHNRFYQTGLFKFLTGNKLGYSEKVETKNLNQNQFGVLLVPADVSIDEWEKNNIDEAIDV